MKKINVSVLVLFGLIGWVDATFAVDVIATKDYVDRIVNDKKVFTANAALSGFVAGAITDANGALVGTSIPVTISANSIAEANITAGAVTSTKIADGAVTSAKIADGAITNAKIATGAVTSAKIAAKAINNAKIATGAVTSAKIAAKAITNAKIATGAVTSAKIATGAITNAKIAANAVTGAKIKDGAINASAKIADGTLNLSNFKVMNSSGAVVAPKDIPLGAALIARGDGSLEMKMCDPKSMLIYLNGAWTCTQVI